MTRSRVQWLLALLIALLASLSCSSPATALSVSQLTSASKVGISTYDAASHGARDYSASRMRRGPPMEAVGAAWADSDSASPVSVAAKADVGLSSRGLIPAAGTRIRPAGIPEGWRVTGTKSPGGVLYRDPANSGNSVRVMQGNPNSPFPNSQGPYVRWQKNGQPLDQFGNQLPSAKVPEAHIPLGDFRFRPEVFD